MTLGRFLCAAVCAAGVLTAQDRDFLTPNEVDQIRVSQDPNDRLILYVQFAKTRMDMIEQYLANDKPGRGVFVHNTLEDYSKIIEAIDAVSDDALLHHRAIDKGTVAVIAAEKEFLEKLNKIQDSEPKDISRYKFVLSEAIDATGDSKLLSTEDAQKRGTELSAQDEKEKKAREAMMPTKEVSERKKAANDQNGDAEKKKIPSLLRPGEKPPGQ